MKFQGKKYIGNSFNFLLVVWFLLVGSIVNGQYSTKDLQAYWSFDGHANDISGNNHHGEVVGAKLTVDRFGNEDKAYLFDGIDDYISVKSSTKLDAISESISISAWVKPNDKYYNTILAKGSLNFLFQLVKHLRPGILFTGLSFDYNDCENYWGRILLYEKIPENEWTHIACTYDQKDGKTLIYINGTLAHQSITNGTVQPGHEDLRIGARIDETYTEYMDGSLDDVFIYSRSLNQVEINNLFNNEFDVSDFDLHIFPNPAVSEVNFKTEVDDLAEINIFDTSGQKVYSGIFQPKLNIRFLATGMYFVRINNHSNTSVFNRKLIVNRNKIRYKR